MCAVLFYDTRTYKNMAIAALNISERREMFRRDSLIASDRRRAAIHEAGHIIVGGVVGLVMDAYIVQIGKATNYDKSWIGRTCIYERRSTSITRLQWRMVAVAGAVAERCWQREIPDAEEWSDPEMMSASDWRMAKCHPGEPDKLCIRAINDVAGMFDPCSGDKWGELCRTARQLIIKARRAEQRISYHIDTAMALLLPREIKLPNPSTTLRSHRPYSGRRRYAKLNHLLVRCIQVSQARWRWWRRATGRFMGRLSL